MTAISLGSYGAAPVLGRGTPVAEYVSDLSMERIVPQWTQNLLGGAAERKVRGEGEHLNVISMIIESNSED